AGGGLDVHLPLLVAFHRIHGNTDDLGIALLELTLQACHGAEFRRADRREILRMREKYAISVADPLVEADRSLCRVGLEIRCYIVDAKAHCSCPCVARTPLSASRRAFYPLPAGRCRKVVAHNPAPPEHHSREVGSAGRLLRGRSVFALSLADGKGCRKVFHALRKGADRTCQRRVVLVGLEQRLVARLAQGLDLAL